MFSELVYLCAMGIISAGTVHQTSVPVTYKSAPSATSAITFPSYSLAPMVSSSRPNKSPYSANHVYVKTSPVVSYQTISNHHTPMFNDASVAKTVPALGTYASAHIFPKNIAASVTTYQTPFLTDSHPGITNDGFKFTNAASSSHAPVSAATYAVNPKMYKSVPIPIEYTQAFPLKFETHTAPAESFHSYSTNPTVTADPVTSNVHPPIPVLVEYTDAAFTSTLSNSPISTETYQSISAQEAHSAKSLRPHSITSVSPSSSSAIYGFFMPVTARSSSTDIPYILRSVSETFVPPVKTKPTVTYSSAADVSHVNYNGMGVSFGW